HLTGRPDPGAQSWQEAIATHEQLIAEHADVPAYREALAGAYATMTTTLKRIRQGKQAEETCRKEGALREKLAEAQPDKPAYRYRLANCLNELGLLLMGRDPEAEPVLERAAKLLRQLADQHPDELHYRGQLAGALHNRAELFLARGDPGEARKLL